MKLRRTPAGLIAEAPDGRWFALPGQTDLVEFLAAGEQARRAAQEALDAAAADPAATPADPADATLPFRPRSIRAFMLWESHYIASARALVKHFFPAPTARVICASA